MVGLETEIAIKPKLVHVTTIPDSLMFLTGQIGHMQTKGFEVHAISAPGDLPADFARREQIIHHPVDMTRRITPMRDTAALASIAGRMRGISPAIVHSHTPKGGLLGMMAATIARVPVRIYHIHGLPFITATGRKRQILRYTETIACRLAHQVLCVSRSVRDVAVSEGFCPPEKIKVLCGGSINGVEAEARFNPAAYTDAARTEIRRKYEIPPDAVVVGFVGRIVRDKGIIELAQAWQQLRDRFNNAHLMLVGDIEDEDPVPEETRRILESDNRVHFTGLVWDMPDMYAAMDIVVLPTYREGFPVVPLETAAMALPIVATTVPGCIDAVVDNVTGTLVPPGDADALKNALASYLDNPDKRSKHGQSARKRALTEFCPADIWEATYAEYRSLLLKRGLPADGLI